MITTTTLLEGQDGRSANNGIGGARVFGLGVIALIILVPVTLPVTVLRGVVLERFQVSELQTSFFMSINMIGAVLFAPVAGMLSDRLGRRRNLILSMLVVDGACWWLLTRPMSFEVFLGVRFVEGVAHIFALSLLLALASDLAGSRRRGRVMGAVGAGITLGVAVGAPLGGVLGRTDPLLPLYFGSGLAFLSAMLVGVLLREATIQTRRPTFKKMFSAIAGNRWLLLPLVFAFADRFTVGFFTTTFSLFMKRTYELTPPQIGLLLALFLFPFGILSYFFGRLSERVSKSMLVCLGSLFYGIGTATLGWWPPDRLWILMLLLGVTSAVMFVPCLVMTVELASTSLKATAIGVFNAAGALGFVVGPIVGGWISQTVAKTAGWHSGYQMSFVVAGLVEIGCVLVAFPMFLKLVREGKTT